MISEISLSLLTRMLSNQEVIFSFKSLVLKGHFTVSKGKLNVFFNESIAARVVSHVTTLVGITATAHYGCLFSEWKSQLL